MAYIDFQPAFDSVSHPKLLHKLSSYGIHGNLLFWIASFLSNRIQQVRVGSSLSKSCAVTSGVPQGSVIGPLLFNLYINDITDHLDCSSTSKLFADDIKIYTELTSIDSHISFQNQLDLIHHWSECWQLPISHSKCYLLCLSGPTSNKINTVSFSISNIPLSISQFSTDLGVTIDSELKFTIYVNETVARAKQRAAIIHRCFLSRNANNLITAFKTYVGPLLEYATQIWSPYQKSSINAVESVQRAFTKRLSGLTDLSYNERLVNLKLQSLEHRRLLSDLTMCFNIVHGFTALQVADFFTFSTTSTTRGHSLKLVAPPFRNNVRKFVFSSRVVPVWNSLPEHIVNAQTSKIFKRLLSLYDLSKFLEFPCLINI